MHDLTINSDITVLLLEVSFFRNWLMLYQMCCCPLHGLTFYYLLSVTQFIIFHYIWVTTIQTFQKTYKRYSDLLFSCLWIIYQTSLLCFFGISEIAIVEVCEMKLRNNMFLEMVVIEVSNNCYQGIAHCGEFPFASFLRNGCKLSWKLKG